jgi:hypothetical protein
VTSAATGRVRCDEWNRQPGRASRDRKGDVASVHWRRGSGEPAGVRTIPSMDQGSAATVTALPRSRCGPVLAHDRSRACCKQPMPTSPTIALPVPGAEHSLSHAASLSP